jgi:hypothetical protein
MTSDVCVHGTLNPAADCNCKHTQVSPDSHQAHQLKQAVEDQIIKEGLVGVGIVGGLLGVGAVILSAAFSRR